MTVGPLELAALPGLPGGHAAQRAGERIPWWEVQVTRERREPVRRRRGVNRVLHVRQGMRPPERHPIGECPEDVQHRRVRPLGLPIGLRVIPRGHVKLDPGLLQEGAVALAEADVVVRDDVLRPAEGPEEILRQHVDDVLVSVVLVASTNPHGLAIPARHDEDGIHHHRVVGFPITGGVRGPAFVVPEMNLGQSSDEVDGDGLPRLASDGKRMKLSQSLESLGLEGRASGTPRATRGNILTHGGTPARLADKLVALVSAEMPDGVHLVDDEINEELARRDIHPTVLLQAQEPVDYFKAKIVFLVLVRENGPAPDLVLGGNPEPHGITCERPFDIYHEGRVLHVHDGLGLVARRGRRGLRDV